MIVLLSKVQAGKRENRKYTDEKNYDCFIIGNYIFPFKGR